MALEIITKDDLEVFRLRLLEDLKQFIETPKQTNKEWLKSHEVKALLKISPGTLQNLRVNGTLNYTKIGNIIYYNANDITKILEGNKAK
jgi:hypothetical protein